MHEHNRIIQLHRTALHPLRERVHLPQQRMGLPFRSGEFSAVVLLLEMPAGVAAGKAKETGEAGADQAGHC
jgi:hypothetical protein